MKRYVSLALVVLAVAWLGTYLWQHNWSPSARAIAFANEAYAAAARGDESALPAMLAPNAEVTATGLIDKYRGKKVQAFDAVPFSGGTSPKGVQITVLASWSTSDGVPHGTMLAVRRDQGRWQIVLEGTGLAL